VRWFFLFLAVLAMFLFALVSWAGSVTFADVCTNVRIVQNGPDLEFWCPREKRPWLTYVDCRNALYQRQSNGNIKVICNTRG
jgi:hypothetical protein